MNSSFSATRKTAACSGAGLALGLAAYDQVVSLFQLPETYATFLLIAVLVLLFFVPVVLFVSGTEFFAFGWRDIASGHYWREFGQLFIRALCWLAGAGAAWAILAAFRGVTT
jgi:hypothetical protein